MEFLAVPGEATVEEALRRIRLAENIQPEALLTTHAVDEDDRLQPQVELIDELDDVAGLIAPVDAPAGQICAAQHHLRMTVDGLQCHRLVVLAHEAHLDSAPSQLL